MLFLLALMGALMLTNLAPLAILGIMAAGWVIAVAFEWAASRNETHYGSGLPPRYYVPQVSLPPARPLEQVGGYPEQRDRDEAPTWIASAAMREELLGAWPGYAPPEATAGVDAPAEAEESEPHAPEAVAVELAPADTAPDPRLDGEAGAVEPAAADAAAAAEAAATDAGGAGEHAVAPDLFDGVEPVAAPAADEAEVAPESVAAEKDEEDTSEDAADAPIGAGRRRRFWQRDVPEDADPWQAAELPLEADAVSEPAEPAEPAPDVPLAPAARVGTARHSLDPLAEPERSKRPWQRGAEPPAPSIEVRVGPAGPRALPRHATTAVRAGGED